MLEITGVGLDYAGVIGVRDVDLELKEGELVGLVGSNGAGKSSLLAAISGLHRPIRGRVVFDGVDVTRMRADQIARRGLALVPEGRRLFSRQTVRANLLLGAYGRRDHAARDELLEQVFGLFPVLRERLGQQAGTLSGGEQQMLALGRALMSQPKLLLLDEPSLGLAPVIVDRIYDVVRELNSQGVTILLVEQNANYALDVSHRGYVLETGTVALSDDSEALRNDEAVQRAYLGT